MIKRRLQYVIAIASCIVVVLWLFCLPGDLFEGTPYSTVVTAANGELLGARVADDGQWRFPPCNAVPDKFAKALVEYEDRSFYSHFGISLRGIGRAVVQNIRNGRVVSGASTISMQTIRLHRRGRRTLLEKVVEMFMATRLEARYSKEEIMLMYASHAPFGGNVVGFDAAAWRYLGNDGSDMSWAEAATFAVMQNAPSAMHLSKNRDKLRDKRNRLLSRLHDNGTIDDDEYELSLSEPLIGEPFKMPQLAPHLVEHYHKAQHGEMCVTAIDFDLQKRLERICRAWRDDLAMSGINDLAAVVADVQAGQIIAYCGNADINTYRTGCWVDVARCPRSSGSILKPLLYCAALQDGVILERTLLPDVPTDFGGFVPKNFDGAYLGVVPANEALALSLNIPNVHLLKQFGIARFANILKSSGFGTLTRRAEDYGLSLVLGGAEVALVDVVNCYAAMARYDSNMPLSDSTAVYAMFDAMRNVNRPDQLDWSRVSSVQNIAWKTGTSYGARDGWAVGVTPRYVVGVWVGNADGHGVANLTGARCAGPVLFDIFNLLPSVKWFDKPMGESVKVCRKSGLRANAYCVDTEVHSVSHKGAMSKQCSYCKQVPISLDGQRRVVDCSEPSVMRTYFILPPVQKHYYKQRHGDYEELPTNVSGGDNVRFIYPRDGAVITLPLQLDGKRSTLMCEAAHSNAAAEIFWHLDGNYVGVSSDIHQQVMSLDSGVHRISIVDAYGEQKSIEIVVN